jgi:hypothetical protein
MQSQYLRRLKMARCAVVQNSDNLVVNIIIADPSDPPQDGCFLIDIDSKPYVDIGWFYNPATGDFYPPPTEVIDAP